MTRRRATYRDSDARAEAAAYRPGQNGTATATIAGELVEVLDSDTDGPTSVRFPLFPGAADWAIVQIGQADRSRWMVGVDGWLPCEWPTIESAVEAVTNPATLRTLRSLDKWHREIAVAEQRLRDLYAAQPATPAGVVEDGWTRRTVIPPF